MYERHIWIYTENNHLYSGVDEYDMLKLNIQLQPKTMGTMDYRRNGLSHQLAQEGIKLYFGRLNEHEYKYKYKKGYRTLVI